MTTHFAHDEATLTICGRPIAGLELADELVVTCRTCIRAIA